MTLYFAFGSNLDEQQMFERCPSAELVARAQLRDHALCFAGFSERWRGAVASVVPRHGATTPGLVYALTLADLGRLDMFEGHPHCYRRTHKLVELESGKRARAYLYISQAQFKFVPSKEYLATIRIAYRRFGFDRRGLQAAAWGLT